MSLTIQDKTLIMDSFAMVASVAEQTTGSFYKKLFELAPDAEPLFKKTDMKEQGRKLLRTLGIAFSFLNDLDTLQKHMEVLAERHVKYGVKTEHYYALGEALIWALKENLQDDFTLEVEAAWVKIYQLLVSFALGEIENQSKSA